MSNLKRENNQYKSWLKKKQDKHFLGGDRAGMSKQVG